MLASACNRVSHAGGDVNCIRAARKTRVKSAQKTKRVHCQGCVKKNSVTASAGSWAICTGKLGVSASLEKQLRFCNVTRAEWIISRAWYVPADVSLLDVCWHIGCVGMAEQIYWAWCWLFCNITCPKRHTIWPIVFVSVGQDAIAHRPKININVLALAILMTLINKRVQVAYCLL